MHHCIWIKLWIIYVVEWHLPVSSYPEPLATTILLHFLESMIGSLSGWNSAGSVQWMASFTLHCVLLAALRSLCLLRGGQGGPSLPMSHFPHLTSRNSRLEVEMSPDAPLAASGHAPLLAFNLFIQARHIFNLAICKGLWWNLMKSLRLPLFLSRR